MPKALGKIEHKIAKKLPNPVQRFYESYHVTIKQLILAIMIAAIAVIGLEAKHAGDTASKANKEVVRIKQSANCQPDPVTGKPLRPKKCAESIATGFRTLSPLQACELLQKGARVIRFSGQPIPPVTCEIPAGLEEEQNLKQDEREGKLSGPGAQAGTPNPTGSPAGSPPEAPTTPGADSPPGSGGQPQSNGPKSQQPEPQQPSQGPSGPPSGTGPETGSGTPPASAPTGSGGESGSSTPPIAEGGGSSSGGGTGGSSEGGASSSNGIETAVNGVVGVVEEATKPLCEPGLLGVKVCLP